MLCLDDVGSACLMLGESCALNKGDGCKKCSMTPKRCLYAKGDASNPCSKITE